MPVGEEFSDTSRPDEAMHFVVAEYNALRGEIGRYQDHQKEIMNFVILVVGGALTIVASTLGKVSGFSDQLLQVLLIAPIFCCLLCLLYYDRTIRIIRLAHYLGTVVNRRASLLCGVSNVWTWEHYKRTTTVVNRSLALWVDRVRWLMFLLPSIGLPCLYFALGGGVGASWVWVFLSIDALSVVGTGIIVLKAEETHGVIPLETVAPVRTGPLQPVGPGEPHAKSRRHARDRSGHTTVRPPADEEPSEQLKE